MSSDYVLYTLLIVTINCGCNKFARWSDNTNSL